MSEWMKYATQNDARNYTARSGELFDIRRSPKGETPIKPSVVLAKRTEAASDICANRHKGNPESVAAFQSIKDRLRNGQQSVLREIARTPSGLTAEEIDRK